MRLADRPPEQYLRWLRGGLLLVLLVPALMASVEGTWHTPWWWLWGAALAVQGASYGPRPADSSPRLFLFLLLDIGLWNAVVWLTGGATNPFASLLLIPLVLAFLLLPVGYALVLLGVSIAGQLVHLRALGTEASGHAGMGGHFESMVAGFVIAALVLALTLLYLRRELNRRDLNIQQLRESQLRDEQLLAVGTAAAQLTHEMATPVQSVGLLLDELEEGLDALNRERTREARAQIHQQLARVQQLLADWRAVADDVRERRLYPLAPAVLTAELRRLLAITRPGAALHWMEEDEVLSARVMADRTLLPAILSLLHNALEAGGEVRVRSAVTEGRWALIMDNSGRPLSPELKNRLGAELVPSERGFGMGARVSYATVERFGGRVDWCGDEHRTRTRLELPTTRSPDGDQPDSD